MRFYPTKIHIVFACFIIISVLLNFGCSKDTDLLVDSVIEENAINSIDVIDAEEAVEIETEEEISETIEESIVENLESRTASFSPINDAHVQSGRGYNQNIIRLEENFRTSYLMFDLSPIISVDGTISDATLQITINSDDGSGNISVHKGSSSNWTEENLSDTTAPSAEVLIGELIKEYNIGTTEIIELDPASMQPEISTLVLSHKDGNDLAFASKEHASKIGPKLVVTYNVPIGSDEILINEEEITAEETTSEESTQNEGPMAVADATPANGGVPLEVTFAGSNSTDDSNIDKFLWDFKDGSEATSPNPTHTFTTVGVYEVELTVVDEQGLSSTDVVTITVTEDQNEAPKSIITATPVSGEAPLEVTFNGSGSTDDNSIASYAWDLKDGSNANAANFKHTYTKAGTYEVDLTVEDENGLTNTTSITITVTEPSNEAPNAVVSANKTSGVAPLNVQFIGINSTDDKEITSYTWDFKDGATAATGNPSHTFSSGGTYNVNLTVTDKEGLSSQKSITITVTNPQNQPPVANVSANPISGEAPLLVQFLGNSSTDDKAITNYNWNFKDGATATNINPSHTFTSAGSYIVDLTVKDAEGASSTKSVTITVTEPSGSNGGGTALPGYYVSTSGNTSNDGKSPSKPWSLEHAFYNAKAGDIIYVKAGNYGNKQLLSRNAGTSSNPIKFIGYRSQPGDIISSQGSTFNYGESVNASKMPLLQSSNGQGKAITLHDSNIQIENFQINGYSFGVETIDRATNVVLRNIIVTNVGNQSSQGSYTGIGFTVEGNNTLIENCFVLNAGAEAIKLYDSDNSRVNYCKVYANNNGNPTDYYFLLTGGTNNSIIENSYAERAANLSHGGHGFDMKDLAEYNTFRNCTAKRTNIELNFTGVRYNTIDNCKLYGSGTTSSDWETRLIVFNGANNNTMKNIYIQDTWHAMAWADYDDGYVGPGGDRDAVSLGYDNTYQNITVKNTQTILNVGGAQNFSAKASRNKFINCNFSDFEDVARTYYKTENITFTGCSFTNGDRFVIEAQGANAPYSKFNATFQNCSWSNVSFTPPN